MLPNAISPSLPLFDLRFGSSIAIGASGQHVLVVVGMLGVGDATPRCALYGRGSEGDLEFQHLLVASKQYASLTYLPIAVFGGTDDGVVAVALPQSGAAVVNVFARDRLYLEENAPEKDARVSWRLQVALTISEHDAARMAVALLDDRQTVTPNPTLIVAAAKPSGGAAGGTVSAHRLTYSASSSWVEATARTVNGSIVNGSGGWRRRMRTEEEVHSPRVMRSHEL